MGNSYASPDKITTPQGVEIEARQPGKTTQIDPKHPTGNAGIDNAGGVLMHAGILAPDQRATLNLYLFGRVAALQTSYIAALTELRVERMIEKEDELPIALSICLGVVSHVLEGAIVQGVKALSSVKAAAHTLVEGGVHAAHETTEKLIGGITMAHVELATKQAIDIGKDKAKGGMGALANAQAGVEKSQAMGYLDSMADASMMSFQSLREDATASLSDSDLLLLFASLDGKYHTKTIYVETLGQTLRRFLGSSAKDIGRKRKPISGHITEVETHVAYLHEGPSVRQIYTRRVFKLPSDRVMSKYPSAYQSSQALSLQDTAEWPEDGLHKAGPNNLTGNEDELLGYVEDEFVDVAMQIHRARWQAEPRHFVRDWSDPSGNRLVENRGVK